MRGYCPPDHPEEKPAQLSEATKAKYLKPPVIRGVLHRFPRAILAVAALSAYGARKHQVSINSSITQIPDAEGQWLDALGRHLCEEAISGQVNRSDGGHLHATQEAWNALARLEVMLFQAEQGARRPHAHDPDPSG